MEIAIFQFKITPIKENISPKIKTRSVFSTFSLQQCTRNTIILIKLIKHIKRPKTKIAIAVFLGLDKLSPKSSK